ncbi:MAG: dihydroorotase [Sphingobacteriales bacterium]|nr:dihydroorotase [Sphingobacteriales bacterium]
MQKYLFKDITVVNEGVTKSMDVLIEGERIERIDPQISVKGKCEEIIGVGKHLLPGVIDDQVHFREPGLTHKATIETESKAAVAGGITSFMEMPNTIPNALTIDLLEQKYQIAANTSAANYSFFMGVSNDNAEEVLKLNKIKNDYCGVKIFMGSSTGNMLVDNFNTLEKIFSETEMLIATHCEDETIIRNNYQQLKSIKSKLSPADHAFIRDEDACYESSLRAVKMAQKYNSRLHILHISTEKELQLFGNMMPLKEKRITAEVCVHHLHFTADDYEKLGYQIKCNPAIKAAHNKSALWKALLDDRLDIIATDHAPHTMEEKEGPYEHAHSGLPLVQHALQMMLMYVKDGKISIEKVVEKMSHSVADCFGIQERGYIREGYFADLVMVDLNKPYTVAENNIMYKCGWSPLLGVSFPSSIIQTIVSGNIVFNDGTIVDAPKGKRMTFDRN